MYLTLLGLLCLYFLRVHDLFSMADSVILHDSDLTLSELLEARPQLDSNGRRSTRQVSENQKCSRINWTVNFRNVNMIYVHSPKEANIYYCHGECLYPLNWTTVTNHSLVQSYSHTVKRIDINQPCCVPTKLSCLNIEYYIGRNKTSTCIENMVVEECGCL